MGMLWERRWESLPFEEYFGLPYDTVQTGGFLFYQQVIMELWRKTVDYFLISGGVMLLSCSGKKVTK